MGERVGSTVSRVAKRLVAAECTHRGGPPLPVPGRDVPRCPLGPKGLVVAYAVGPEATAGSWAAGPWGRNSVENSLVSRRPARDRG